MRTKFFCAVNKIVFQWSRKEIFLIQKTLGLFVTNGRSLRKYDNEILRTVKMLTVKVISFLRLVRDNCLLHWKQMTVLFPPPAGVIIVNN